MLEVGTIAPDFCLLDQDGHERRLSDFAGQTVVLYFYSKDNTSGCTAQARGFTELADEFAEAGAVVIGVSKDSHASHKRFEERHGLRLILLADPDLEVLSAYDVLKERTSRGKKTLATVRTTYVIAPDGTIAHAAQKVRAATNAADTLCLLK